MPGNHAIEVTDVDSDDEEEGDEVAAGGRPDIQDSFHPTEDEPFMFPILTDAKEEPVQDPEEIFSDDEEIIMEKIIQEPDSAEDCSDNEEEIEENLPPTIEDLPDISHRRRSPRLHPDLDNVNRRVVTEDTPIGPLDQQEDLK